MASGAGFLRHFRETITEAIADSNTEIRTLESKLAEARTENERLRTLALADGIVYDGGATIHLLDTVGDDDREEAA